MLIRVSCLGRRSGTILNGWSLYRVEWETEKMRSEKKA
jgi:hypothetical protein